MIKNSLLYIISRSGFCLLAIIAWMETTAQYIIPKPQQSFPGTGSFIISADDRIVTDDLFAGEADFLRQELSAATGFPIPVIKKAGAGKHAIILRKAALKNGQEGYQLTVTPSAVIIEAETPAGIFYGCVSLLQLMPADKTTRVEMPAIRLLDAPRFKWRGLMLDLSRTFLSAAYIKKTIDRMAFYKLNVLHLHLTDDQGWRSPVASYPLLTEKASKFDSAYNEPAEFQGHYTQEEVRALVSYAAARHVELVPEIESPGHSHAALFAYPSLLCQYHVAPVKPYRTWEPTVDDVFCVSNPESLQFFRTVINETAALFPSGYFHLGGDEVPRNYWQSCARCQALMKSAKLGSTSELQGYFMQQLHDYVIKTGKRPVAWDEILHDNNFLTKDWVIMSWTGSKPGWEAAAKGYDVVMTPTSHMYFDYGYDAINTKKIFEYDPLEGCADSSLVSKHILGIQANFWSHIDRTESKIDYQLFPRLLALAERGWSNANNRNYEDFRRRRDYHKHWLESMDVKYFTGDFR